MRNALERQDEEILASSIENPSLFGILVDRYQGSLFRAAFSVVRQKEEAEDIVQEAFTKIYLHAKSFKKQEGASFKSWAHRIAINSAISRYRKLKRIRARETTLDTGFYENLAGEEDLVGMQDARMTATKLLERLPEDLKSVVSKYYFEDKSYDAIATEEGIPLSTLKMRLFRAKKLLKNFLYVS